MIAARRNPRPAGRSVFALKDHKIDHVVHGAIASAVVFAAPAGGDGRADRIGHRAGRGPLHSVSGHPGRQATFRLQGGLGRDRAPKWPSSSMRRAMRGFVGPADIFRNPEAIFCLFEKPAQGDRSPFDLTLSTARRRFRRDGNALQARAVRASIGRRDPRADGLAGQLSGAAGRCRTSCGASRSRSTSRRFSIIGDPAKRDPHDAAKRRSLDGLHHRHAAAQGVRAATLRLAGTDARCRPTTTTPACTTR